jgi:serine/threonine protein kinase
MAVRDVVLDRESWTSPFSWRDYLPMELAVHVRLHEQAAHEQGIHRYSGHRLDMPRRRYRVYNDVCEFGDLYTALGEYSKRWRRRRDAFKWLEAHPEIARAREVAQNRVNEGRMTPRDADSYTRQMEERQWTEYVNARLVRNGLSSNVIVPRETTEQAEAREFRTSKDFDDMTIIVEEGTIGMELSAWPPGPVIPEDFLWHIFRQLVEAITVMHQGNGHLFNGKEWKEIVHCDIHGTNIFVKLVEGGEGTALSLSGSNERKFEERTFTRHGVSIAMSFF